MHGSFMAYVMLQRAKALAWRRMVLQGVCKPSKAARPWSSDATDGDCQLQWRNELKAVIYDVDTAARLTRRSCLQAKRLRWHRPSSITPDWKI